jgi:alpha-methylacyl-CoA racemase
MLLADLGADVVVVDRPVRTGIAVITPRKFQLANRGKRVTTADIKTELGVGQVRALAATADGLLEGFRPGTMERLGLGPGPLLELNPRLVYCRITGWGQTGPRSATAGHDLNYIAVTGALAALGRVGAPPTPPANLLGDYAGGTMFAVVGLLAALLEAQRSGRGQVIDAAMTDGVGVLLAPMAGMIAAGHWRLERGTNLLDTGAPFYDVYRTRDGGYLAIGAIEDQFFAALADGLGLEPEFRSGRWERARWPALRDRIAAIVAGRTRDEWMTVFEGSDACVAPVLDWPAAVADPANRARSAFAAVDGIVQPAPAPRFSRTPARTPGPAPEVDHPLEAILEDWRR